MQRKIIMAEIMNDTQPEWVLAQVGQQMLGVDKSTFFYHVNKKEIAILKQGKRSTLYKTRDILQVKASRQYRKRKPAAVTFDWLYPGDVLAGLALDQQIYNEVYLTGAERYQSWRRKNPYLSMAAYDEKDRSKMYGYIGLLPLPESVILQILSNQREETSIEADEIETYDQPGGYILLANSAAIHPDRPDLLHRLLRHIMGYWLEQYPERYIKKIYAQAVSDQGEMLVQHLFMTPRYDLAYNAYELDMSRPSASRIIRNFKEQLQAKAPLPIDLQWPPITPQEKPLARPTDAPVIWKDATPQTPIERPLISPTTPPTIWQTVIPPMRPKEPQIATTEALDGVSLRTFASIHHINPRTATDQARIGTGGEILDVTEREAGRGKDKWFVTPEQQHQAIAFWQKHKTPGFTPCPDCPH